MEEFCLQFISFSFQEIENIVLLNSYPKNEERKNIFFFQDSNYMILTLKLRKKNLWENSVLVCQWPIRGIEFFFFLHKR